MRRRLSLLPLHPLFLLLVAVPAVAPAQPAALKPGQVLVSGTVPDESAKAILLQKVREIYGPDLVVDQVAIGAVSMPPGWTSYVQRLIAPNLKLVSRGSSRWTAITSASAARSPMRPSGSRLPATWPPA
jgi:OOP family OmpA-OmpF porin